MGSSLQPGVEALGYVKITTPDLLSSTRAFRVVLLPSWVSISPPKPSRATTSPTTGFAGLDEPLASAALAAFADLPFTVSLTLAATFETLVCFLVGGSGAGAGALRLRSSTGMATLRWGLNDENGGQTKTNKSNSGLVARMATLNT